MGKRIIISTSSDLCIDQRVQKVTLSLQNLGFEVLLVGFKRNRSRSFRATFPYKRKKLLFEKGFLFHAEMNIRLFIFLLFTRADILLSNNTDTLLPNYLASRLRHKKLILDVHEILPEMPEVVYRIFVKKWWTIIENLIFPRLKHSITVSDSIANYYNNKYGIKMMVIRNMAYLNNTDIKPLVLAKDKKIILYQGALKVGKGLEWVINSMPLLDDCVLVIIGSGMLRGRLKRRISKLRIKDKVQFVGKILPEELIRYTKAADIGLCLLEQRGISYYYSLPNRVFDYIQAGIPILATNFPEISNIVKTYSTGVLIDHYEPAYLAEVITKMLETGKEAYQGNLSEVCKELCWENEQEKLLILLSEIIEKKKTKSN